MLKVVERNIDFFQTVRLVGLFFSKNYVVTPESDRAKLLNTLGIL